ncbi:MAG: rhomboid family intramembrane serine protease [Pirellulales bacterium]|nr:rhomboid family intramembrane serine protease [Pirellulales bacterium]
MGLYDRDYYRSDDERRFPGSDQPMVFVLMAITIVLFVADYFSRGQLGRILALKPDVFLRPWNAWQLLTYGFAHDTTTIWHVGLNMFALWFFGRDVEELYGRRTFAWLYLTGIVIAGLVWAACEQLAAWGTGVTAHVPVVGASGGVCSVMIIYACNFPKRIILIWGLLPVPAVVLVGLYILQDIASAVGADARGGNVAYMAHLGGAAYGWLFYRTQWSFGSIVPALPLGKAGRKLSWPARRPKLRLHEEPADEPNWQQEVDEVLAKISREGEASLTPAERRKLEDASRRFQERRR